MKRISLSLLATLLAVGTVITSLQAASLDEVRAEFSEKFPQIKPESIRKGPVDGLLEIRQGTLIAYLTEDGRYLFQGALIDLDSNVNLTDVAASGGRKDLMQASNEDAQIVFAPEKPRYSVAVFTDIDCTFCRKLHR
ncbi:MAG: disulfide isomerase DsbC N-terminal domain-containing protein, partial [Pseudomonadota bacterium]